MKTNTKTRYASTGFKPVDADSMRDAAEIFALRAARRWYGKRACVGALNDGVRYVDGRAGEFDAFIGRPCGHNQMTGHDIHFIVFVLLPAGVRAVRTGEAAIRLAENTGVQLYCYANPVDDGGPVTLDQAREIAKEDANLIYAHETY
jgi:hypothetical protein